MTVPRAVIPGTVAKAPKFDVFTEAYVDAREVYEQIHRAKSLSDHVALAIRDGAVFIEAEGVTSGFRHRVHAENASSTARTLYLTDYLLLLFRPYKKGETVLIKMDKDFPLVIESHRDGIKYVQMVAPRIERE